MGLRIWITLKVFRKRGIGIVDFQSSDSWLNGIPLTLLPRNDY